MKCPHCDSEDIEVLEKSVPTERNGWRHHHGSCRKCRMLLWWNAPVGHDDIILKSGIHECPFFIPPAAA